MYTVSYLLSENVTLSTELVSKECENMAELEFGMGCLLNPTLIFTEQLLQSTGPNQMPQLLSMSVRHKSGVQLKEMLLSSGGVFFMSQKDFQLMIGCLRLHFAVHLKISWLILKRYWILLPISWVSQHLFDYLFSFFSLVWLQLWHLILKQEEGTSVVLHVYEKHHLVKFSLSPEMTSNSHLTSMKAKVIMPGCPGCGPCPMSWMSYILDFSCETVLLKMTYYPSSGTP